jgi:hypothetical protein
MRRRLSDVTIEERRARLDAEREADVVDFVQNLVRTF